MYGAEEVGSDGDLSEWVRIHTFYPLKHGSRGEGQPEQEVPVCPG